MTRRLLSISPLLSHLFENHPLSEARDGKRERLKQSASKLACQKAPGSTPPALYQHNPGVLSSPPPLHRLLPSFCLHFLLRPCTLPLSLSLFPPPSLSLSARFKSVSESRVFSLRRGEAAKGDGCMGRERRTREKWTAIKWTVFREREM